MKKVMMFSLLTVLGCCALYAADDQSMVAKLQKKFDDKKLRFVAKNSSNGEYFGLYNDAKDRWRLLIGVGPFREIENKRVDGCLDGGSTIVKYRESVTHPITNLAILTADFGKSFKAYLASGNYKPGEDLPDDATQLDLVYDSKKK